MAAVPADRKSFLHKEVPTRQLGRLSASKAALPTPGLAVSCETCFVIAKASKSDIHKPARRELLSFLFRRSKRKTQIGESVESPLFSTVLEGKSPVTFFGS